MEEVFVSYISFPFFFVFIYSLLAALIFHLQKFGLPRINIKKICHVISTIYIVPTFESSHTQF